MQEITKEVFSFTVKNRSSATRLARSLWGPTAWIRHYKNERAGCQLRIPAEQAPGEVTTDCATSFSSLLKGHVRKFILEGNTPAQVMQRYKLASLNADVREFSEEVAEFIDSKWPDFLKGVDGIRDITPDCSVNR